MEKLTKRELSILEFIKKNKRASNAEIMEYLASISFNASRITVIRSVSALIKAGLIERKGESGSVYYEEKSTSPLLAYFDAEEYFKKSPDERNVAFERFNFGILTISRHRSASCFLVHSVYKKTMSARFFQKRIGGIEKFERRLCRKN